MIGVFCSRGIGAPAFTQSNPRLKPKTLAQCDRYWASPIITGSQAARTSSSNAALSVTSGPMPAGSPMVRPMRSLVLAAAGACAFMRRHSSQCARWRGSVAVSLILVHILDVMFENEQVRAFVAVQFDAVFIVPFDCAAQFLIVPQYEDHRSVRVHLLLIIEALRVGLLGRNFLLLPRRLVLLRRRSGRFRARFRDDAARLLRLHLSLFDLCQCGAN